MIVINIILSCFLLECIKAQGVGKVFIGTLPNNTLSSISINENSVNYLIPVFIENRDPEDNTILPITGDVRIQCELSTTGNGFSSGNFVGTILLNEANRGGSLPFTTPVPGQAVDIRCFGESLTSIEFNRTVSISDPATFTIEKAPTVSICPTGTKDVVAINTLNTAQNFTVRLSDRVVGSTVTITCTRVSGGITFQAAVATVGNREVQVTATLTAPPATATCRGQSATGGQYLNGNSIGPAVTFQLLQPSVALYPPSITTSSTSFASILLLTSAPVSSTPTTFHCRADLLALADVPGAIQNPFCRTAATAPPGTDNSTIDTTPNWGVLTPDVSLDSNVHHFLVKATRNLAVTEETEENVVVSCCSTSGVTLETTVWARVSLTPNATVDWTISTDTNNFTTPRTIQNVAYVNIAPCPCNLVEGVCDINCCCDAECTTAEQQTFTRCIPYLEGGQAAALPEYMCKSDHFSKEDWFHLMCVTSEYNSLLGFFYQNDANLRTTQGFNERVSGRDTYSYRETEERVQPPVPAATVGYRQTEKVLSVRTTAEGLPERRGVVSLPQRILSGECAKSAPLQYLKNIESDCSFELTAEMCSDNSVFNALSYMQSSRTTDPSCPSTFSVMGNHTTQNVAETVVSYYCMTDTSSYIKSTTTVPRPSTRSLFNYTYPAGCAQDVCGRETDTESPCTGYDDSVAQEVLPPRCTFNDQFTRPPSPTVNGATCENAVVNVRYNFYWSGQDILKLNATVFLANIAISTSTAPVVVTQKYKADFVHSYTGLPNSTADNFYNVDTAFSRSGKPGYDLDKLMISGMEMRNETNNLFLFMNSNSSRRMTLWNTGFDGLCLNAGRRDITFGRDTFTSCNIYIGVADLQNCTDLNKLIINRLDNLMPSDRIGRYGNNNPYGITQWVQVLREDLTPTCTNSLDTNNQTVLSWQFAGFCTNIVSGINLDIMYGESGKANGVPTKEIIGAYISYDKSTWQLSCGSGSTSQCSDPSYVEPFPVTASVRFIKVPANTPQQKIRWKVEHPDICYRDVCWENFMYPLERAYTAEPRQYVLAMVLVLILFFIGFLFITRPWW